MTMTLRSILFALGGIAFVWFIIPLAVTGNFNIGSFTGVCIGLLLLCYASKFNIVNRLLKSCWQHIIGRIVLILLIVVCTAIICLAAATGAAMLSALNAAPSEDSTVIVLGARVYKNRVSTALRSRLDAAAVYLMEHPDAHCIVTGGQGDDEQSTESSLMYAYLVEKGIAPERIYQEDQSTDTKENFRFSKKIIDENGLSENVAVATEGYHLYRALGYADEAGLKAGAIPAASSWWYFPSGVVREMYGILEQWFL